ncbi:MAG: hypothetical protein IJS39_06970 [Synergistaceae bacterium]|nr:hypothetical protein [Synergistaceae bacterium]
MGRFTKVAFTVTDLPESARLWGSDSPYWKKPDPSLVMPNRYVFMGEVRQDIGKTRQVLARTERDAMKLRGVRIYSKTSSMYSNGIVYPGLSYEIHVPVYNASFLPSDGKTLTIPAKLYYRRAWSDETGTLIGTPTATTNVIGGWKKGTENNKALLRFNWDNVPELQEGAYEFYVVLDPDNQIDEVHEAWTTQTPESNNNGYYPFGISYGSKTSEELIAKDFQLRYKARSAKKTGTASAALRAANDNEYDDWSGWENVNDDTDFPEMVENETEFVVSAEYAGEEVRHEVWAEVLMDFTDDDGEEYTSSFGGEMFPLLAKGDRIEFSFLLNETEIQNGRNLRLTIADSGSYVEYIVDEKLSSDNTGDVPESEDVQPEEKLINEVITQSYELEKDSPVLWRLGNVTVSSDALLFEAAADDLVKVSVVPADAETSPVSKVTVTASTIAGKTLEGVYRIPVQTSTDGSLWDEDIVLTFTPGSPDGQGGGGSWSYTPLGSSGNSCGTLNGGEMLLVCAAVILKGRR